MERVPARRRAGRRRRAFGVLAEEQRARFLKERDTGNLLYLLVPSVTIRADRSVLPDDGELLDAAQEGIMEAVA